MGLIKYEKEKAFDGYVLVEGCRVLDMNGNDVQQFPGFMCVFNEKTGEIISAQKDQLVMFNKHNEIKWKRDLLVHHDIRITPDNNILALTYETHEFMGRKVRFDGIELISPDGKTIKQWSVYEHLPVMAGIISNALNMQELPLSYKEAGSVEAYIKQEPKRFFHKIPSAKWKGIVELTHLNSIQVIPQTPLQKKDERFAAGNWLLSFGNYSFVAIMNPATFEIIWINYQTKFGIHEPSMLANGNILIYLNSSFGDWGRQYANVIEFDPLTSDVVWEYTEDPPEKMKSPGLCGVQRLSNGNTLITDNTHGGRVFEVTPEKEIVWDWVNNYFDSTMNVPKRIYRARKEPKEKMDQFIGGL